MIIHIGHTVRFISINDTVMQQLLRQALPFCPENNKSEVSDRSFCCRSDVIRKQQHSSNSSSLTPLSALFSWSQYHTLDPSPNAACSPPALIIRLFPPWSLGETWKCINLDSSLQSKGSFEETLVVSPECDVTPGARGVKQVGKRKSHSFSLLARH